MSDDDKLAPGEVTNGDPIPVPDIFGNVRLVPRYGIRWRPGSYAVITRDAAFGATEMLVVLEPRSKKLFLPGGGIRLGEHEHDAVKREVLEESGYVIVPDQHAFLTHTFLTYLLPKDGKPGEAWHVIAQCFCATIVGSAQAAPPIVTTNEGEPLWMNIDTIQEKHCYGTTFPAVRRYQQLKALKQELA